MAAYRTAEYRHLIAAERAISESIKSPSENESISSLSAALVKVIDMKRAMRGIGNPKPVDYGKRKRRSSANATPAVPTDIPAPVPIDAPSSDAPAGGAAHDAAPSAATGGTPTI